MKKYRNVIFTVILFLLVCSSSYILGYNLSGNENLLKPDNYKNEYIFEQPADSLISQIRMLGQSEFDMLYSLEQVKLTHLSLTPHDTAHARYLHLNGSDSLFIMFLYIDIDSLNFDDIISITGKCDTANGNIYVNVAEISHECRRFSYR